MEQTATSPQPSPPEAEREKEALVGLWLIYRMSLRIGMNLTLVQHADFPLWERYLDLVSAELFNDGRVNFRRCGAAIRHGGPRLDGEVDGAVPERADADARLRRLQHARIGGKYLAHQWQNLGHVAAVGDADGEVELADFAVVMEDFADDLAVGNHHD